MEVSKLTPELAKQILEAAAVRGVSVEELLESVIESGDAKTEKEPGTAQDKVKLWQEWVDSHSYIKAAPLSDYAVSRESIYTREDEML
ncbi:MAG TPA: hypothetical protein VLR90_05950 [Blastocatellia bacterium]|nr:hypothetical protein [Blastocatellia bacterium]